MSTWGKGRDVLTGAVRDLRCSWRSLAITDIAYKAIAFALLVPGTSLLLYWLRSDTSSRVMADVDIARFFVTTPVGVITILLGGSLTLAITALETACLMAIGLSATRGARLGVGEALVFGAARAPNVLRLAANVVVRVIVGLIPFLGAAGLVYWGLLREHDINYYLSQRPPEFMAAAVLAAAIGIGLAALIVRTALRWALAMPLLLFEKISPRRALGESARRSKGHGSLVAAILAAWGAVALALIGVASSLPDFIGRKAAPLFAGSLTLLLLFIAGLAILWMILALGAAILNISLFSLLVTRLYLSIVGPDGLQALALTAKGEQGGGPKRLSGRARAGVAAVAILAGLGFALLAFLVTRSNQQVLVIAHRGSSAAAPENTLAAFRLAAEQGADYVELDVQESADGEVLVVHDADLMKVGSSPMKIWENDAARLRSIDIGSHLDPQFSGERVPTLAEALAVCKGRCRVIVELKSYGHDVRLEERVAEVVEAAGMENDCIFMSLDHRMVGRMKRLRPDWRTGVLVAKAIGDLTSLGADFLAVEAKLATPRLVRRAHRAGQDVYVWTLNDPAAMLRAMSRGVDGLITDKPDLARKVVARRAGMSDAQRLLVALLIRAGEGTEELRAEEALRP